MISISRVLLCDDSTLKDELLTIGSFLPKSPDRPRISDDVDGQDFVCGFDVTWSVAVQETSDMSQRGMNIASIRDSIRSV